MTQGRSGNWTRRLYEIPSARLVQAEREVYNQYGVEVSVDAKAKSLLRFGKSGDMTVDQQQLVWTWILPDEIYLTANTIEYISSSNLTDTQTIRIEGHTIDANGDFTFVVQTVQLNGFESVSLPIPLARVSAANNVSSTDLQGHVYIYEYSIAIAGIPNNDYAVHLHIPQGSNQSYKAATTFDKDTFAFITHGFGGVSNKQTANIEFELQVRPKGGVFTSGASIVAGSSSGNFVVDLDPVAIVPANADVRIVATSDNSGAQCFVNFNMYMAKVL